MSRQPVLYILRNWNIRDEQADARRLAGRRRGDGAWGDNLGHVTLHVRHSCGGGEEGHLQYRECIFAYYRKLHTSFVSNFIPLFVHKGRP
ncbi:hypothetical protein J6590_030773 [Homalodisca vitripennis]|nr:hypothetical protein J6590_030773 [Homalodisca vitripennis]